MPHAANNQRITDGDMSADIEGSKVNTERISLASFHFISTGGGSPTGTLYIRASNKENPDESVAADWVNLGGSLAITADVGNVITVAPNAYRWLQPFWDFTSGTGSLQCFYSGKTHG